MILQDGKAALALRTKPEDLPQLSEWLETLLEEIAFPVKNSQQVMICADEVAANVTSYAYPEGEGPLTVSVSWNPSQKKLTIVFSDQGIPFDPLQHKAPDTTAPVEQRKVGGLGILVVQRMMDHVEYRRDGGCNILTLEKTAEEGGTA